MKTTRLMWWLAMCILPTVANAQLYTYQDVDALIEKSKQDSIAEIERMAALEFHKLINKYRTENGLSTIKWNETLWIATINHNKWMTKTGTLSHHQTTNNKYFTGKSPGDRLSYAQAGNSHYGWSGENALYNYSSTGKTKEEIAKNIAQKSFTQWKNSPGHNENMLSKRHGSHGVAFAINGSVVWGTDLFSSYGYENNPNNETIHSRYYAAKTKTKTKPKSKRFSTAKNRRLVHDDLITSINDDLHLKNKNWSKKSSEAKRLAYRIASKKYKTNNSESVIYTETKATHKKTFLGLFNKSIHTYSAIIEKDVDDFNSETISNELATMLKDNQPINPKSKIDVTVLLKKRKNLVRLTMVSVVQNPTGKINVF